MHTIGLLGGMSWESSIEYYRIINEYVRDTLGGLHSAQCLMYSVDFAAIEARQIRGAWDEAGAILADAAQSLERGGANFIVLCTNTMHKVAPAIQAAVSIPLLHIADPTAEAIQQRGIATVGLLGTRFTMEQEFYRGCLSEQYSLNVLVPDADDRDTVHRIIYEVLCLGKIVPESRCAYQEVMARLVEAGAEAIILGCTEITLLVGQEDSSVPLFDTTRIHAETAAAQAIRDLLPTESVLTQ